MPEAPSHIEIPQRLRLNAKQMRKAPTDGERKFWHAVRAQRLGGLLFRRQVPIAGYIVDFVCHEKRLVVEIDGAKHGTEAERARDAARTEVLVREGYRVIRFWNEDVARHLSGVLDRILHEADRDGLTVPPVPDQSK
jgi:very-short-patch-repair endonuclease